MPFPFTFNFSVPGLSNPFYKPPIPQTLSRDVNEAFCQSSSITSRPEDEDDILNLTPNSTHLSQRQPSPQRNSKKRGWEPSYHESSHSMTQTTLASSSGYLDTPAKYRALAEGQLEETFQYIQNPGPEVDDALQPPAKRRRGLAGSIVSTALSAALIGTAVGLTVYRLWRDRGKAEPLAMTYEQPPPPPYSEAESRSRSLEKTSLPNAPPGLNVIPPTPVRRIHPHKPQRSTPRRRRVKAANLGFTSPSSNAVFPKPKAEFDFSFQSTSQSSSTSKQLANEVEVEDQMDWIGDKLSMLIEEGKRALGREVVVSSECAADEVDDGSGGWVEEHEDGGRGKSRSSSPRRVRRKESQRRLGIRHSPTSSHSGSLPSSPPFSSSTFPASQAMAYGSLGSTAVGSGSACESPEIRESMERARRKAMEARAARAAGAPFS